MTVWLPARSHAASRADAHQVQRRGAAGQLVAPADSGLRVPGVLARAARRLAVVRFTAPRAARNRAPAMG